VQTARIPMILFGRSFYLISQSVWKPYETLMIGRIVIKYNLYWSTYWQVFVRLCLVWNGKTLRRFLLSTLLQYTALRRLKQNRIF